LGSSPVTPEAAPPQLAEIEEERCRRRAGLGVSPRIRETEEQPTRGPRAEKLRHAYDPHLPSVLCFDPTGCVDCIDDLIEPAIGGRLSEDDGALLRQMLGSG